METGALDERGTAQNLLDRGGYGRVRMAIQPIRCQAGVTLELILKVTPTGGYLRGARQSDPCAALPRGRRGRQRPPRRFR